MIEETIKILAQYDSNIDILELNNINIKGILDLSRFKKLNVLRSKI